MAWFNLPVQYLRCFSAMLPRIKSEEALNDSLVYSVGAGLLKAAERKTIIADWQKQARGGKRLKYSENQAAAIMAQMGIQVKKPKKE